MNEVDKAKRQKEIAAGKLKRHADRLAAKAARMDELEKQRVAAGGVVVNPYEPVDDESIDLIIQHLSHGAPLHTAVRASGVDYREFSANLQEGIKDRTSVWAPMAALIEKALAQVTSRMVKTAVPANDPDAAWRWLQATEPAFMPKVKLLIDAQAEQFLEAASRVLPEHYMVALLQAIQGIDSQAWMEDMALQMKQLGEGERGR